MHNLVRIEYTSRLCLPIERNFTQTGRKQRFTRRSRHVLRLLSRLCRMHNNRRGILTAIIGAEHTPLRLADVGAHILFDAAFLYRLDHAVVLRALQFQFCQTDIGIPRRHLTVFQTDPSQFPLNDSLCVCLFNHRAHGHFFRYLYPLARQTNVHASRLRNNDRILCGTLLRGQPNLTHNPLPLCKHGINDRDLRLMRFIFRGQGRGL